MLRLMARLIAALLLTLTTAVAAPAQTAPAAAPPGLIPQVRAALNANDIPKAQALIEAFRAANGTTPEALEAFSWLGRGALAQKKYDEAEQFALDAYDLCLDALKTRPMDAEPRLPIAIGAAMEVRAQVMARSACSAMRRKAMCTSSRVCGTACGSWSKLSEPLA